MRGGRVLKTNISCRHIEVAPEVKEFARDKLEKLERYYDRIQKITLIFDHEGEGNSVEAIINIEKGHTLVGLEHSEDFYIAIDNLVNKMERQLTKHKEKLKSKKHRAEKRYFEETIRSESPEEEASEEH